ncbi:MAG: hypothetical protein R3D60_00955 [Paracoccaceae bacterium]
MFEMGTATTIPALLLWPLVVWIMFRKISQVRALIWSILAGYMFLPQLASINLPMVPPLDKESIPNLTAFAIITSQLGRMPRFLPDGTLGKVLIIVFLFSPVLTVLTNLDPILFGRDSFGSFTVVDVNELQRYGLPGLRIYDSLSALVQQVFLMLPFFLAREVLRTEEAIREVLVALVIAGAIYALPMLWEVRFSPQLHTRIYGYFQHNFLQAMREGGFRPFVFMPHGLWVAFFAFMCTMAAAALYRTAPKTEKGKRLLAVFFMLGLVVICKSLGSLIFTLIFAPVVIFLKPSKHIAIATLLATVVLTYPLLRGSGLIPTHDLIQSIAAHEPERAQSLEFRFDNEDVVLDHAAHKPLFGWGGWGRSFIYNERTGRSDTVVDGQWIITISQFGWVGFLAAFGLMAYPIFSIRKWAARVPRFEVPVVVSALVLIHGVNMSDMLPNATLIPFTWLVVGALLGYAESLRHMAEKTHVDEVRGMHGRIVLGGVVKDRRRTQKDRGPRTVL